MNEVTKTQVCEKYMEEIDKTMNFLQLMRQHCERLVIEEETKECGMCCDGMNDPENRGHAWARQRAAMRRHQQQVEELRQLKEMEHNLKGNVFLKVWDGNVDMMCDILTHYDQMCFPEGIFKEQKEQPEKVCVLVVNQSDLPLEVRQYLFEHNIQHLRDLFGR